MLKTLKEFLFLSILAIFVFAGTNAAKVDEYIVNKNSFNKQVLRKDFPEWYFSDWRYSWKYSYK